MSQLSKTNIVVEKYETELAMGLSSSLFNLYQKAASFKINSDYIECYTEYLSGSHIIVTNNKTVSHGEGGMFMISDSQYIYASCLGWQLLEIKETIYEDSK